MSSALIVGALLVVIGGALYLDFRRVTRRRKAWEAERDKDKEE